MASSFRDVIEQLTQLSSEFERQAAKLQQLSLENEQLREIAQVHADAGDRTGSKFRAEPGDVRRPANVPPTKRAATDHSLEDAGCDQVRRDISGLRLAASSHMPPPPAEEPSSLKKSDPSTSVNSSSSFAEVQELSKLYTQSWETSGRQLQTSKSRAWVGRSQVSKLVKEEKIGFMIMRAGKTKEFSQGKPWYVINPESNWFGTGWQCITCAALIFVALVTPLQIGFFQVQWDFSLVFSILVDTVFLIDSILQFFTSYRRLTARGMQWEVRLHKIAINYLKTWFVLDVITLVPFDILGLTMGNEGVASWKSIRALRVLRLLKLFRLLKTSRIMHRFEIPYSIPYQHIALFRFLVILLLMVHWQSCVWAMTLQLVDGDQPQWLDDIEATDLLFGADRDSALTTYIASFYFCSYTMTSVGYGDLGPKNIVERLICIFMVMSSGLCWAYVLGEVCAIVADFNAESQIFRKKMHHLNRMMADQELPFEMRSRLRSFFLSNRFLMQHLHQQELLGQLSPQLQSEVCTALHLTWIAKVHFFAQFMRLVDALEMRGVHTAPYRACVADISRQLELQAFAQQDSFDNVQVLYILSKGLVALNSHVQKDGAVWGEDFVLSDTSLIRPVAGYALTYIEVLYLTRERFMGVIERRKRTCPQLGYIVRRYCVRVAVFRGVIAEARRRVRRQVRKELAEASAGKLTSSPPQSPDSAMKEALLPGSVPETEV